MVLNTKLLIIWFSLFNLINCNFVYPKVYRDENLTETKFDATVSEIVY